MFSPELILRIHEVAMQIEQLPVAPPEEDGLSPLFALLRAPGETDPDEIEAEIWDQWCGHEQADAAATMTRAMQALNSGQIQEAEEILDRLVKTVPDWAEAWNKRATLYFALGRDAESVSDIQRTLELEPRHFGALCGFAQIAARGGDTHAARVALERALLLHPGLSGARLAIAQLGSQSTQPVH